MPASTGGRDVPMELQELRLGGAPDAAPRARRFAGDTVTAAGLSDLADDVVLAVAELVTNAQLHGSPPITVRLITRSDGVRVEVHDGSRVTPVRGVDNVDAMTGRGLRLVSSLATAWGVEPTQDGKVVWCDITRGAEGDDGTAMLDELDLDALLEVWQEEHAPSRYTIHLGDVPTELLLAAKAHVDNLVREFALAAGGAVSGHSAAIPPHLVSLIETVVQRFADARQSIKRQAVAAAGRGEVRTNLTLTLPVSAADAGEDYLAALDEADGYARAARLLTLEAPPAHKVFRRWYVESIVGQLRAVARGVAPPPVPTFEQRLLAEIESVTAAHLASERAARLQSVTPALAAASTVEDVATVVVNEGVNALDASGGVLLLPSPDGRLRVPGAVGYAERVVAGLRAERIDAELPAAQALRTGEAVWLESQPERDARFPDLVGLEPDTVSVCAVPLIAAGRTLGVLRFSFDAPRLFDEDERRFVMALAAQTAQALDRSQIYGHAQEALARRDEVARTLQASVNACREGVVAVAPDSRILAVNTQFFELWRLRPRDIDSSDTSLALIRECMAQAVEPGLFETAIARGHGNPAEVQDIDILLVNGRIITGYGAPLLDDEGSYVGRVWYLREDTERRAAERQRVELLDRLASVQRSQRFLLEASDVLAGATGFGETLERLAGVAVPTLGDLCLIDVVDEHGGIVRMAARHADPACQPLVDELHASYPPEASGAHPSVTAIATGESLWSPEMTEQFLRATTRDERHLEIVRELGFTSYITVPLIAEGSTLGSFTVVSAGSGRRFGPADVALAEELAGRVALVVAKARRYDRERELSHALQASLLPAEVPDIRGLSVAVRYLAGTRDAEVGGDFYDVVRLPSGEISLAIGDVAGHDVTAAATMAELRSACRALGASVEGPADLLRAVHATWEQLGLDRMATAVFARLEPSTGRLRMVSAGHLPPVLVHDGRAELTLVSPAGPLGAPETEIDEWHGELPSGAALVFYTDGLVEDRQRDIDEGTDDLIAAAAAANTTDPAELADWVLASLVGDDRSDDVALLVIRRD